MPRDRDRDRDRDRLLDLDAFFTVLAAFVVRGESVLRPLMVMGKKVGGRRRVCIQDTHTFLGGRTTPCGHT